MLVQPHAEVLETKKNVQMTLNSEFERKTKRKRGNKQKDIKPTYRIKSNPNNLIENLKD